MTVREVVVHRDVRAPASLSPRALLRRQALRRTVSALALVACDVGAIACAATLAPRLLSSVAARSVHGPSAPQLAAAAAATVAVFLLSGLYGRRHERHSVGRFMRAALLSLLLVGVGAIVATSSAHGPALAVTWVLAVLFAAGARTVYDAVLARVYQSGDRLPVLLVGNPESCTAARRLLGTSPQHPHLRVIGMLGAEPVAVDWQQRHDLLSLGLISELEDVVRRDEPAEIVVADPELARAHMPELIETCRRHRLVLKLAAPDVDFGPAPVTFVPGFGVPVFVVKQRVLSGFDFYIKRGVDMLAAALLTVVLAPLLAAIAVAIRLESGAPVFFVDDRIGLAQRVFRCYKFRTMRHDAAELQAELEELNEAGGALFKIRNDPRVTRVGKLLRRTSLDELPQLVNVLKGQMSLVGPRPLPLRDFRLMDDVHKQRHVVLPGITGLWQVSGRSDLSFDDMIELDFRYIETWSLSSDFVILLRTLGVVFRVKGAY